MAAHESPRTTKLYDRRSDVVSLDEVQKLVWLLHMGVVDAPVCNSGWQLARMVSLGWTLQLICVSL